ncbi:unnamed protein product [Prorocentrum cordatum]|uniref:Uncharacterized protein n=1 Tax=Prorocentrum cordatum TaxID=2364126 RepID=A0ABN9TY02_9DINO|nr:unnamed protein product [Polarella glacialis]
MPARERPDAQGGRPQLVRRQSDGLSTGELLTENGELRREVRRLRSTPGREEGLSALERAQAEIASLRQQLKDQALRDQEARAATAPEAVEGAAAQADMDIQPRSRGKHFHIRGWTSDPQEPVSRARATGAGGPDSAGTPGPPEDSAQLVAVAGAEPAAPNEGVLVEMMPAEVEEEPPRTGLPAAEGSGLMSWARGEDAVRQLLKRAEEQLEAGSLDGAGEAFREALDAHLADAKRPYLAFSAALRPALHGHLVGHGLLTAGGEADRPADPACAAARRESYAELIRRAVADHPPAQRPRGTSRSRHVREHCAHAGLCLDLALLDRPGLGARAEAPQGVNIYQLLNYKLDIYEISTETLRTDADSYEDHRPNHGRNGQSHEGREQNLREPPHLLTYDVLSAMQSGTDEDKRVCARPRASVFARDVGLQSEISFLQAKEDDPAYLERMNAIWNDFYDEDSVLGRDMLGRRHKLYIATDAGVSDIPSVAVPMMYVKAVVAGTLTVGNALVVAWSDVAAIREEPPVHGQGREGAPFLLGQQLLVRLGAGPALGGARVERPSPSPSYPPPRLLLLLGGCAAALGGGEGSLR